MSGRRSPTKQKVTRVRVSLLFEGRVAYKKLNGADLRREDNACELVLVRYCLSVQNRLYEYVNEFSDFYVLTRGSNTEYIKFASRNVASAPIAPRVRQLDHYLLAARNAATRRARFVQSGKFRLTAD
eukprot:scaffold129720_cov31-Prasinocladus_malaysianus.AAC.2